MARNQAYFRKLRELEKNLLAVVDQETIYRHLAEHHGKEIINAVIGAARAGIGPDNKSFPKYSPEYAKRKAEHGKTDLWLRGIERAGRADGMLGPERFSYEIVGGRLFLVWTAGNAQMAIYGEVHQEGLPLGRGGPRKQRRWMHLESATASKAVQKAFELTIRELSAQAARGKRPR